MINPPIIVDARGGILIFRNPAEVGAELDPARIRNGDYPAAYDWNGRLLRIQVRIEERSFLGMFKRITEHIEIFETEHIPTHEAALRALVSRFIHPGPAAVANETVEPLAGLIRIRAIAGTR
jgi:hypothetical protein